MGNIIQMTQVLLVLSNFTLLTFLLYKIGDHGRGKIGVPTVQNTFSPLQSIIQHRSEILDLHPTDSPFGGEARPEVDQAWDDLLRGTQVTITEQEMRAMNKTSVRLRDRSGYVGYIEVFHMLHCVKRLYQSIYPEYYSDLVETGELDRAHLVHCLEAIRKGIMCNADVTIDTYTWNVQKKMTGNTPDTYKLKGNTLHPRRCVDWERIMEWADERATVAHYDNLVPGNETDAIGPLPL